MEFNENNIINQILNDETIEEKKTWLEYVKDIYDTYINTLNNENVDYMNSENEKVIKEKLFKTSDFSLKINNSDELEIGHCMRENYFRFKNSYSDIVSSKVYEEIEKNILYKEQFLRKLKLLNLIEEPKKEVFNLYDIKVETTEDAIIIDYDKKKEYLLFIKPVNDSVGIIKNKVFSKYQKPIPLNYHLPEIILCMYLYRKPAKIIYIGKNNPDFISEFNFGFKNSFLSINNEASDGINIKDFLEQIEYFSKCISEDILPNTIFTNETLNNSQVIDMKNYGIIEDFEVEKLLNGQKYKCFQCNNCKYKTTCENLQEKEKEDFIDY